MEREPRFRVLSAVAFLILCMGWLGRYARVIEREQSPNPLVHSASFYLRSCSNQPIEWREWGAEVFEEAQRSGKPVYAELGASWSAGAAWANEDVYHDEGIANLLNTQAIPVKVDFDSSPKVARHLLNQAEALGVRRGIPVGLTLDPEGIAIFAIAVDSRTNLGRALDQFFRLYKNQPQATRQRAEQMKMALTRIPDAGPVSGELLDRLSSDIMNSLSQATPGAARPLTTLRFAVARAGGDIRSVRLMALQLLWDQRKSARWDDRGFGFFVDQGAGKGQLPFRAKRAIDNALYLDVYCDLYDLTKDPAIAKTALDIVEFLRRDLWDERPAGFRNAALFQPSILTGSASGQRDSRISQIDTTLKADAQGAAIVALCRFARVMPISEQTEWARDTAERTFRTLQSLLSANQFIYHTAHRQTQDWVADDAWAVLAALELSALIGDPEIRAWGIRLLDKAIERCCAPGSNGAFYDVSHLRQYGSVVVTPLAWGTDEGLPSDNAVVADVLIAAARMTGEKKYRDCAENLIAAFAGSMAEAPLTTASLAASLQRLMELP